MSDAKAVVITVSTRAAAGTYDDASGPVLVAGLSAMGFATGPAIVVPDGDPVTDALREAINAGADVVVTTGGTGLSPTDRTPEMTAPFIDRPVPGIAEALRADAQARNVPMGMISRGIAGLAGRTLIINVAGSPGAARDAIEVLRPVLIHAVDQLRGGTH